MIAEIWNGFRRLPLWVQVWVICILVPVNVAALYFIGVPFGPLVAGLAIGGMMPNLYFIFAERGWSKIMAVPHLSIWTPLVVLLAWLLLTDRVAGSFASYCLILLIIDLISLAFDFPDALKWWRGDRDAA